MEQAETHHHQYQPLTPGDVSPVWDMQPEATIQQDIVTEPLPDLSPWLEQDTPTELDRWGTRQFDTTITLFDATTHNQNTGTDALPTNVHTDAFSQPETPHIPYITAAEEAEAVPLLSSRDQYVSELWRIARLSPDEEQTIVEQARTGDQQAKNTLIESCLVYVMHMAKVYHVYFEHDDLLDIVQVGNLAIIEKLDKALTKENTAAYLRGVAKQSIKTYCLYHSRLMPIKDHQTPIAEVPKVTSLDALRPRRHTQDNEEESFPFDPPEPEHHDQQETDSQQLHTVRQALAELTHKQQEVIAMRHGLTGNGSLQIADIARQLNISENTVKKRYYRTIVKLRKLFLTGE
jgi:RNA polymerase sigma factor (sigma-70 family)